MKVNGEKDGYGYLINWLITIGDLLLINTFFITAYLMLDNFNLDYTSRVTTFMLINLSYFITSTFVRINLSSNIIYFEKIVQRSSYFIIAYSLILTVGIAVFRVFDLYLIPWLFCFFTLGALFILWHIFIRLIIKQYRRKGGNYRKVVIVGGGLNGINIYNELSGNDSGYKIIGFFDDNSSNSEVLPNYLGRVSDVQEFAMNNIVDEIYCTLPYDEETKIAALINFSEKNMIRFYLVPEFYRFVKRRLRLQFLETIPIISLRYEPLQYTSNRLAKRCFDIFFSLIVLVLFFPIIFLIFGIAIKLSSPGPIFFKQKRTGFQGKEFDCYKFRSMKLNSSANSKSATKSDPRVTKVGAFMRKTSIDELPQFINVFKGDMSIVGPRPHMIQHTELYSMLIDRFMVRHLVKPGITGWAQVTGYRGETKVLADMEGRVKKDVWYIENWSFFLDLKIIFLTVYNVFRGEENAY